MLLPYACCLLILVSTLCQEAVACHSWPRPVECSGCTCAVWWEVQIRYGWLGRQRRKMTKMSPKMCHEVTGKLQDVVCKPLFFLFWWCSVIQQGVSSPSIPFRHSDQANRPIILKACTGWILGRYCLPWTCPHSSPQAAETSQPPATGVLAAPGRMQGQGWMWAGCGGPAQGSSWAQGLEVWIGPIWASLTAPDGADQFLAQEKTPCPPVWKYPHSVVHVISTALLKHVTYQVYPISYIQWEIARNVCVFIELVWMRKE